MTAASSTVDGLTTASPVPLTQFESPPPAPLQHTPASLGDHIGIGFKNTVAEASREGGGWEAVKVALRSVWMVLDFSLVGPLSQVPMAVRVLSFYFADKLRGKDNGILRDVSYGEKAHQKMDVYLPQQTENEGKEELLNSAPPPLVMFVHGGSWASGDKWHYALLARRLRAQGAVVAVVGYALYPSQTFEGMCEDVNTAFDFAISPEGAAKYGADPGHVPYVPRLPLLCP